ncbi:MAG: YeeE/YedE family protein [Undibacterium sp.]|nr:YeeE/YedE family protein [Undibacterium sp.]
MHIDWEAFTPFLSTTGGVLIGLAAMILLLGLGRIAGIVGIVAGLIQARAGDWVWRVAFIFGLLIAPMMYQLFGSLPKSSVDTDWFSLIIAGLFVGVGTRLGSGCTSGHGVCGIARFSTRSIVATLLFMSSGFATVYFTHHFVQQFAH